MKYPSTEVAAPARASNRHDSHLSEYHAKGTLTDQSGDIVFRSRRQSTDRCPEIAAFAYESGKNDPVASEDEMIFQSLSPGSVAAAPESSSDNSFESTGHE